MRGRPPNERCSRGHEYTFKPSGRKVCVECQRLRNSKEWEPRHQGWLWPHGAPARLLDLLETERAWLCVARMALRLNLTEETVSKALVRLRQAGLVQSRMFELGHSVNGHQEARIEWRVSRAGLLQISAVLDNESLHVNDGQYVESR